MRNKATPIGILIAVATVATVIGTAMISGSSDSSSSSNDDGAFAAANGVPIGVPDQALPQTGGEALTGDTYSIADDMSSDENLLAPGSAPESAGVAGASVGVGTAQTGGSGSIIDRKIERTSTLAITVDNVLSAVSKIQAAATGAGGYVSQQSISEQAGPPDEDGKPTKQQLATVQIRVPSESYDNVMSGLRGIAKEVTSENSQTVEVTAQYADLQSQLRNLEATERQYLALLERAATIEEILTVSDRLGSVRLQIEQVQGQINLLDNLTSLATITINVTLPPVIFETVVTEPAQENFAEEAINNAWESSQDVLEFMAVAAITAGVVMIWILVPGVLGLAGWRLFGGRRGPGPAAS
jgi:hypothetical protein